MKAKPKLSIIVLSYNTKELLMDCLTSLEKVKDEVDFEVLVPDNGSSDGSPEMVEKQFPDYKVIRNNSNLGFAAGNNAAREYCRGKFILFLNSDTVVHGQTLKITVEYLEQHPDIGALTCKIVLPSGKLDKDTRRAFITPWIGLTHIFLHLDKIFPKSELFAKYWYGYIPDNITHEVDVLQGAFFLARKEVLNKVGWFDEDYFLDGEDIDLSWRIKEAGWKILYYSEVSITHFKGASKGKVNSHTKKYVPLKNKLKFRVAGVNSMELFYKKRLWNKYPILLNLLVLLGIKILKLFRIIRTIILG